MAQADATGTNTQVNKYGAFGELGAGASGRFGYTGQQVLDGSGLYYYKARVYSPALGRFLQTDPIGTADDLNLYAYVGNNPVNYLDPTGLSAEQAGLMVSQFADGVGDHLVDSYWAARNEFRNPLSAVQRTKERLMV